MPIEVLSNQASKRLGTINGAIKMQRILFHSSHDIKNKLLIIIHADKINVQKREIFLKQNLELSIFETHKSRRSPPNVPSSMATLPTQE